VETIKTLAKVCSADTRCSAPLVIFVSGREHCNQCNATWGGKVPRTGAKPARA
jgi:hypothetical protein